MCALLGAPVREADHSSDPHAAAPAALGAAAFLGSAARDAEYVGLRRLHVIVVVGMISVVSARHLHRLFVAAATLHLVRSERSMH